MSPAFSFRTTVDLALVLKALSLPLFEPLEVVAISELSLKTILLFALASAKRIGDLQALSVGADCISFGAGDCNVTLRPKAGYVPRSLSTPFRAQVISLSAFSSEPVEGLKDGPSLNSQTTHRPLTGWSM